jgi:hypothetical protein
MTTDVQRALDELVAIGAFTSGTAASEVRDFSMVHARSLAGLEAFSSLATLSLTGCEIDDYSLLGSLNSLGVLIIENSNLSDVSWAAALELRVATLRQCRLRDAVVVSGSPHVQMLDLTGNPLNAATRAAAETARHVVLALDDLETNRLNVELADRETGIVVYRDDGELLACATGLDLTDMPEAGHPVVTEAQVRAVLDGSLSPRELLGLA